MRIFLFILILLPNLALAKKVNIRVEFQTDSREESIHTAFVMVKGDTAVYKVHTINCRWISWQKSECSQTLDLEPAFYEVKGKHNASVPDANTNSYRYVSVQVNSRIMGVSKRPISDSTNMQGHNIHHIRETRDYNYITSFQVE
tara:strand:+ start:3867 stop:4298 length:432 start_codon:yes stop_codon:yes gene_type:complete